MPKFIFSRHASRLFLIFLILLICACEQPLPQGTVALVNGEPISLYSVQALLDSRSAALGIPPRPSVAEMQENYRHAVGILTAHTLVRQELDSRGIGVNESDVDKAIHQVIGDYGEENLADFLAEASLREDEWRLLVRDHLALQTFTERILLPSIKITLNEIREYYNTHKQEFALPEHPLICHAAADRREALESWCDNLAEKDFEPGPLAQCMEVTAKDISLPWQNEIGKLEPSTCGSIIQQEGQWRVVGLRAKNMASVPPLSEVYGFIEKILLEQKKLEAFDEWLAHKMACARILCSPGIFPAIKMD